VGSRYIEPMPLRDSSPIYAVWRRGEFDYEVTLSYYCRGEIGHDSRVWPFRGLAAARAAIPPWLTLLAPDPDDSPELVEVWA
jgi:hypothetical protein